MALIPPVQPGQSYAATGTRPEPAAIVGNGGGQGVASAAAAATAAAQTQLLDPLMAALAEALSSAAARQNGLAPLLANLEALMARADLPEAVRNATQSLLNLRLSSAALESGTLRQAVSRSGLFVEAVQAKGLTPDTNIKSALQDLRSALQGLLDVLSPSSAGTKFAAPALPPAPATPAPGAAPQMIPQPAASPEAAVRQAATAILSETEAALAVPVGPARPAGLPMLPGNLEALLAQPDLPDTVRLAGQALLALRLSSVVLDDVARPVIGPNGLPLGLMLPDAAATDAAIKVGLQGLRDALKGFLGVAGAAPDGRAAPLPPPFRGALPVAQPPVPATITGAGLQEAATKVLAQTDAAIARHVMLQIASLPAAQQPSHPPDDHTQRLVFDIPLITPQGATVVQLQIERDARQRDVQAPVWIVRFAVDMEPIGPVRARVAQIGGKTSVTLVAEKPASAAALQQDIGTLKAALSQADLAPGDLHCLSHDQTKVTAPQGQFVNRAS